MELVWWMLAFVGPFAGYALGAQFVDWRERVMWRRAAAHLFVRHPMSTKLPTEIKPPTW